MGGAAGVTIINRKSSDVLDVWPDEPKPSPRARPSGFACPRPPDHQADNSELFGTNMTGSKRCETE